MYSLKCICDKRLALSLSTSSASLFQLWRSVVRPRACRRRRYPLSPFSHLLFALLPDPSSSTDMLSDLRQRLSPVKCAAREVLRLRRGRFFVDSRRGPFSVSRSASGLSLCRELRLVFFFVNGGSVLE
ncbi:hypothetical protein F2Q68_00045028 [Brassica cretica]|uniref:Uncharacterized protein n=1 Tax=Brassica cretica TaxID=69181 RepID=A0A8S9LIJ4_BRACR|nr:hypothetical protein F2Q68_00045028 [Brassica cretica]